MYCGHARLCVCMSCLSVCLSASARPHYCTDLDVTYGSGRGCPIVVHYWADLQSVHGLRCYGNITRTRNASQCMLLLPLCVVTIRVSRIDHEKCIVVTRVCVSVRGRMPTLLHGPGCNLEEWHGMPPSCAFGRICNRCTGCVAMATL